MSKAIKIVENTAHKKLATQLNSFNQSWWGKLALYGVGGIGAALFVGMLNYAAQNALQAQANSAMAGAWWGIVYGGGGGAILISLISVFVVVNARKQQKEHLENKMKDLLAYDPSLKDVFEQIDRQLPDMSQEWIDHCLSVLNSYEAAVLQKAEVERHSNSEHATQSANSVRV